MLAVYFSVTQSADTKIALKDADGKKVFEYAPSKQFRFITLGSDDITDGTYTLCANGSEPCTIEISGITGITDKGESVSVNTPRR